MFIRLCGWCMGMKINQDLPQELADLFKHDNGGMWEIVSFKTNPCDQDERIPHIHNNELTIVWHPIHRNSYTIYFFFTIKDKKVDLSIFGTKWDGRDIKYGGPPFKFQREKIMKVKEYLQCLVE